MSSNSHTTIRVSLRWVALTAVLIFVIGIIGGLIGVNLSRPPLPPLDNGQEQLITTVQEVTISPSKAAADVVHNSQRAIISLVQRNGDDVSFIGLGVVLTNDGLVASTVNATSDGLLALDDTGRTTTISKVGSDALFGLTYYELSESVVQPFEIESNDPNEGATLLAVNRSRNTLLPVARQWPASEYELPNTSQPDGRQRILVSNMSSPDSFDGSVLLTDEGVLAGLLINASGGVAIPASEIRASLNRATTGQREHNPFTEWGFSINHTFAFDDEESTFGYSAITASVTPRSPAAISALRVGDIISEIQGNPVSWSKNLVQQMSTSEPITLTILRDGKEQQLVLNPPATSGETQ